MSVPSDLPDSLSVDFRRLFAALPSLYLVLDPDLRIVTATDALLNAGMVSLDEVRGRNIFEAFPGNPDDPGATGVANLRQSLERVLETGLPDTMAVQQYDVGRPASMGGGFETRHWSPRNTPMFGADGRLTHILHEVVDVTEYVREYGDGAAPREEVQQMQSDILRHSKDLQEANRSLRAADEAKNEYLSRVSHELRTPLNAVMGFSELLSLGDIGEENREWAGLILKAGRHLLALLDDVLDIARMEGGRLSLTLEPVPVGALVGEVLDLVRPLADAAGVALGPAPRVPEELCAAADEQRLRQVLMNLLSNAIKYNHPGGSASVIVEERPGQWLRIRVEDTGRGIDPGSLSSLFTPFERLDAAKAGYQGTGLGLALSRHLMNGMGGSLDVASRLGLGSTFWIDIHGTAPARPAAPADPEAEPPPPDDARPATVLYVEDVAENLRLVEEILTRRPAITLLPAMLATTGLDLAREHHPDLILLDLHLPDMPGEDLLDLLRAEPGTRDIPVVVLSADATRHHVAKLRDAGVADYLTKPIGVRELLETVDKLLTAPRR